MSILSQYIPNTNHNTCQYVYAGLKPVCCTEIQYMPLHINMYHYIPIHTRYILKQDQCITLVFTRHTCIGMYHGMYVLVCSVQVFGMNYVMISVNTSKYINTYHNVQYIPFFLHILILVNTFKYMQYILYIPMLTN